MPMYEYGCEQCGRRTEKRQKFSDPPLTACPYCGGTLKKLISAPAIQFKGGGWYADGYGSAKSTASSSGEGSSASAKSEGSGAGDAGKSSSSASSDANSAGSTASSAAASSSTTPSSASDASSK